MISVSVAGLDETIAAVQRLPATMGLAAAFESAGQRMSAIVREATPPGYNRRLEDSVIYEADETGLRVGYESGVESAGNPDLDSVTRPRTAGRSVLANRRRRQWSKPEELASVLEESYEAHADEILSIIERSVADGIS
jgi:hypothetical protein